MAWPSSQRLAPPPRRQRGVVLLALLAILVLALGSVLLVGLQTGSQSQLRSEQVTTQALNEARDALIGWAVGNPRFPGGMPFPDRGNDGNYDGTSDCTSVTDWPAPAGSRTPNVAFGRLPWLGQGGNCQNAGTLGGLVGDLRDGSGERLWYAVSANLLRVGNGDANALVDPQVNWFDPFDLVDTIPELPFDWLTVRDAAGNVLSDRVAFVVLAPGSPVQRDDLGAGGRLQSRIAATGVPDPDEYLDRYTAGGVTYDNAYTDSANRGHFVIAPDTDRNVDADSTAEGFNDRLVYVTVDELLPLVARRVLRDVADVLQNYARPIPPGNGAYPWPAPFGDTAEPVDATEQLRYLKSLDAASSQFTERFGWLAVHRLYMDDRITDERFVTPLDMTWTMTGGSVVLAPIAGNTVSEEDLRSNTLSTSAGECAWQHAGYVDCIGEQVLLIDSEEEFGPESAGDCPEPAYRCIRTVLVDPVRFEGSWTSVDPAATTVRERSVDGSIVVDALDPDAVNLERFDPVDPSVEHKARLVVEIVDRACSGADISTCTDEVGKGTATLGHDSADGTVAAEVSRIRYEVGVVSADYPDSFRGTTDLPGWYVSGGWHRMIALALSEDDSPRGDVSCTPDADCLELSTVNGAGGLDATDESVPALLIFSGRVLPGGLDVDGDGDQDDDDASAVERYFEPATGGSSYDDTDLDDYVGAASMSALRTLLEAEVFNDQIMVLEPVAP